jgi:two-component sensor histidine kinase
MKKLIVEELAPYSVGGQIQVSGSEVQLQPATAQTLALALHELVTNSAKYGALSSLSGHLSIVWQVQANNLVLSWEETGGPLVRKPEVRGFGTRSLMTSIESQLGGEALFDWRSEGLVCRLSVPLAQKTGTPESIDLQDAVPQVPQGEVVSGTMPERLPQSARV